MINHTAIANPIVVLKNTKGIAQNSFAPAQQIVFIDSQVEDYQLLAAGVIPGIEVVVLESDRNGIEQITEVLSQRTDISTIHLVSHGSPGCIYLGNTNLSLNTLNQYEEKLRSWFNLPKDSVSAPLAPQVWGEKNEKSPKLGGFRGLKSVSNLDSPNPILNSLLIYGCNVASGDAGEEFIAKLQNITGAEIFASTTRIGNGDKEGNWDLDYRTTETDAELAFTEEAQKNYSEVLATVTYSDDPTDITIPDNNTTGISRTFIVTDDLTITDVNFGLDINHTYRADLDITLRHPDGTTIELTTDNGGSVNNLYVTFDDSASTNITSDSSAHNTSGYTNQRRPEQALSL